jgi:hypothetical protein
MTSKKYVISAVITSVIAVALLAFGVIRGLELLDAQNTMTDLEIDIATIKNTIVDKEIQCGVAAASLEIAIVQLDQTKTDLANTRTYVGVLQEELAEKEKSLEWESAELAFTRDTIIELNDRLANLEVEYDEIKVKYDAVLVEYEQAKEPYEYTMRDPSYKEMTDFLAADKTNEKPYVFVNNKFSSDSYVCGDYSAELVVNAAGQGIRCAFVYISFGSDMPGHACVAFNTTDKGLVFIEPQADSVAELEEGKKYWQSVAGWESVEGIDYDDTVEEFFVLW